MLGKIVGLLRGNKRVKPAANYHAYDSVIQGDQACLPAEDLKNRGNKYLAAGDLGRAEECYRQAISHDPAYAHAYNNLGIVLRQRKRLTEAKESLEQAIRIEPQLANAYYNLGLVLRDEGDSTQAIERMGRAVVLNPALTAAFLDLAYLHFQRGDAASSRQIIEQGLASRADSAELHNFLGSLLQEQGDNAAAIVSYRRAVSASPDFVEALCNLGAALGEHGEPDEAVAYLRRAAVLKPASDVCYRLGSVLLAQRKFDEAAVAFREAILLQRDFAEAYIGLGNACKAMGRQGEAIENYHRSLSIKQESVEANNNLGVAYQAQGKLVEAIASFRRAYALRVDQNIHSNLIFALDLCSTESTASLQAERKKWDEVHAARWLPDRAYGNVADPERRLRIGYVSADFREHSAGYVFGPMLGQFDPAKFEVFAYSNSPNEDLITQEFRRSVTHWRRIADLPDAAVADMIRRDEIDLLVDLSGHSGGNRLLVFARKPAPIQITAWGYATTTGMRAMDVFLADHVVVPADEQHFYTERIRYLPNIVGCAFPREFPAVGPLPASSAGMVTFGSFNRMAKVTDAVLEIWPQVLRAIPKSRMVIKTFELDDPELRERVVGYFIRAGIDPERLILLGKTPWTEHMTAFNQIDIALDPFPHGGGVTTLESLIMGIPTITLRWPTIAGRLSASILTTLGLTDWIAETPEQYIQAAVRKAQDLETLAILRKRLRHIFYSSIIGDAPAYVKAVEQEYRQLWREWCTRQMVGDKI